MIGWIQGQIIQKAPPFLLLNVNGVGYEVEVSMTTFYQLPECQQQVSLHTYFWVREDAQRLFGFASPQEKALFQRLIKVSGIGAKVALAILSSMTPEVFHACVQQQQVSTLVRVPGIGKRTAERLLVEIKDSKTDWAPDTNSTDGSPSRSTPKQEALEGLVALGYKMQDANKMIAKITTQGKTSAEMIRAVLQGVSE